MAERPILMSAPMVRAILDGSKTQTRRVIAPQPPDRGKPEWRRPDGRCERHIKSPYEVGARLWVRETWEQGTCPNDPSPGMAVYAASSVPGCEVFKMHPDAPPNSDGWCRLWKRRPSIHMPRWASRIMLEVTEVRVERVQDISTLDAMAEGAAALPVAGGIMSYTHGFRVLWDSINQKRGYGWDVNPFCWVVGFKRVEVSDG